MLSDFSLDGHWKEGFSDGKWGNTVEKNLRVGTTMKQTAEKCYRDGAPMSRKLKYITT